MKIYSWNMLYRNRELERAFDFISKSDFDLFCLQEVPKSFLKQLQALPCFIAFYSERERLLKKGIYHNYVVILSKHPIDTQGNIPFPEYWHLLPLRTRLFVWLMQPLGFSRVRNRNGLYVDVTIHGQSVRIFNLHLILAQPAWRIREFELAMMKRDSARPTIVCGDFNTLEMPRITLLNWILGGPIKDAAHYAYERTRIEKCFVEHELVNALSGQTTHPLSRSQLDHILVSRSFTVESASVLPDRIGSDHYPICADVT